MTLLKSLLSLALTFTLSACTITRYYKAGSFRSQLTKLDQQMNSGYTRLQGDYQLKEKAMAQGGSSLDSLKPAFAHLGALKGQAEQEVIGMNESMSKIQAAIAGKSKITSKDPAFKELESFQDDSQKRLKRINQLFEQYTTEANGFNGNLKALGVYPVDVAGFDERLGVLIASLDSQCGTVEKKIGETEQKVRQRNDEKVGQRLQLLEAMRQDVAGLRGVRDELQTFQGQFRKATKGQASFLVTPSHPRFALFQSFSSVEEKAKGIVTGFNQRVEQFNQLGR